MIRSILSILFLFIVLFACIQESELKPIVPESLIHSNSSKIWILDTVIKNDSIISPMLLSHKTTLTFFEDGEIFFQTYKNLGSTQGIKGRYTITIPSDSILHLSFSENDSKYFYIKQASNTSLKLQQKSENINWYLKAYQKPF